MIQTTAKKVPTKTYVDALNKAFELKEGMDIGKNEIISVIGTSDKGRFSSVMSAWKKDLIENSGIVLFCFESFKYRVCNDEEKLKAFMYHRNSTERRIDMAAKIASVINTDRLSAESRSMFTSVCAITNKAKLMLWENLHKE